MVPEQRDITLGFGMNTEARCNTYYSPGQWKGIVPGDLPGESMVTEEGDKDRVSAEIAEAVKTILGWNFKSPNDKDGWHNFKVSDVVKLEETGNVVAVATWEFDRCSTYKYSEARTMIDVNEDEAQVLVDLFNAKLIAVAELDAKKAAFEVWKEDNGLTRSQIKDKRIECLTVAGLDPNSIKDKIRALKEEFDTTWDVVPAPSEKAQ